MMNKKSRINLLGLHIAVLLFGLAGLFGKWIDQHAMLIVLGRVLFASAGLFVWMKFRKISFKLHSHKDLFVFFLSGGLLALHWFSFFQSIQLSSVAIGLFTFSTYPLFVLFLEPVFFRERFLKQNFLFAIICIIGVYLIIPEFERGDSVLQAVFWGVLSGLTFAVLSLLNRVYTKRYSPITISFYQEVFASIFLLPFLFVVKFTLNGQDVVLLVVLGLIFTALAHSLFISSFRRLNAFTVSIITTLEPVYGLIAAWAFLNEVPNLQTIMGGALILSVGVILTVTKS
jgi:drug/metabolite transporter (DMT)-like permease